MEPRDDYSLSPQRATRQLSVNGWLVMILVLLVVVLLYRDFQKQAARHDPSALDRLVVPRGDLADDEKTTVELFKRVSPSVVHVTNLAQQFDARSFNVMEIPQGVGSGFIWDKSGYVVTNFHVVQGANSARVTLSDNTTFEAKPVGADPSKDIAVLKIDAAPEQLQPILLGNSADLLVGQKVFAIGSPFELDLTLTTGVIGGLGREIESISGRPIQGVIQTDAAINPGNSGGPLLDSAGRLIGINTAIASPTGGSVGIGFAVPVDIVRRVVPQLIRTGTVERPGLGVQTTDDRLARRRGLIGVEVEQISPGSAAGMAGMRPKDLITAVDGQPVRNHDELYLALDSHDVGDVVKVRVLRSGTPLELSVSLQSLPSVSQ